VGRSDFSRSEELRATLQSRLRVISFFFAAGNGGFALSFLWSPVMQARNATAPFSFGSLWFYLLLAAAWTVVGFVLRASRPCGLGWLRAYEAAMFTLSIGLNIATNEQDLSRLVGVYELAPIDITMGRAGLWIFTVVAYGTLIPNTARRTAVAMMIFLVASLIPWRRDWQMARFRPRSLPWSSFSRSSLSDRRR